MDKSAVISADGEYRYLLRRRWAFGPAMVFLMLNPSTADADNDDPTIRRCIGFARDRGFGAVEVGNLFALRATDPTVMKRHAKPIGPDNNDHLMAMMVKAAGDQAPVIAAWGCHGTHLRRAQRVVELSANGQPLQCLGVTKDGHPRHPLYVRADQPLIRFGRA